MTKNFWKGKRVFITGHTGFKGSWLASMLLQLGANPRGYALAPSTNPSLFDLLNLSEHMDSQIGDIRDFDQLKKSIHSFAPDILIHMAAQPLVRLSYAAPVDTYTTNVMGTVHVLEACRNCPSLRSVLSVTSDKCYENKEWLWAYRESEALGGHDPYSSSKACAELVTSAYRQSYFQDTLTKLASARAGNVIGGGDWAQDRLIPDIIRAFINNESAWIRNPQAVRPWQHVLDCLSGYLLLVERLYQGPVRLDNSRQPSPQQSLSASIDSSWNFGPYPHDIQPVGWIAQHIQNLWGSDAKWHTASAEGQPHEAHLLKLDSTKAQIQLGWKPQLNLTQALKLTVDWYKAFNQQDNLTDITQHQITNYITKFQPSLLSETPIFQPNTVRDSI